MGRRPTKLRVPCTQCFHPLGRLGTPTDKPCKVPFALMGGHLVIIAQVLNLDPCDVEGIIQQAWLVRPNNGIFKEPEQRAVEDISMHDQAPGVVATYGREPADPLDRRIRGGLTTNPGPERLNTRMVNLDAGQVGNQLQMVLLYRRHLCVIYGHELHTLEAS